jgi:hypothetical protein
VLAKPLHFADLELEFVDCWERLGKELKVSRHQVNRTESTGHMFLVRAHNPKVVSSNLTPATIFLFRYGGFEDSTSRPLPFWDAVEVQLDKC